MLTAAAVLLALEAPATGPTNAAPTPAPPERPYLVRPFFELSRLDLTLRAPNDTEILYTPNNGLGVGLRLAYRDVGVSASFATSADDTDSKGTTSALDLQLSFPLHTGAREVVVGGYFQRYRGYYVRNTTDLDPEHVGLIVRPDLALSSLGAFAMLITNPRFSYDGRFIECRRRDGSSATLVLRGGLGSFGAASDGTPLVPDRVAADFGDSATLHSLSTYVASASLGPAFDLALWRLFLSGMLLVGASTSHVSYEVAGGSDGGFSVTPAVSIHGSVGYAGDRFHGGMRVALDGDGTVTPRLTASFLHGGVVFFAGVRF